MAALAGANLIYGAGMIESGVTFDCGQFVMDNEFARMIKQRGRRECGSRTRRWRWRTSRRSVRSATSFARRHPASHMRELSQPEFLDRRVREDWEARGSKELYTTCLEKARDVVREYRPEPIPDDIAARMHAIVERDRPRRRRRLTEAGRASRRCLKGTDQGAAHAGADRRQRRLVTPSPRRCSPAARRPAKSSTTLCCPAWRWSASACARASASSPRCCSARAPCRPPSTS